MTKKTLFFLLSLSFFITSCEKDDFCSEATTPKLIITFYDAEAPSERKTLPIYVWAEGKENIYEKVVTDSIAIPLNTQTNQTKYYMSNQTIEDFFEISYETEDEFVSRSCGFKTLFKSLSITEYSEEWIKNMQLNNSEITNEEAAHLSIFH